jgi:hypothetical protein
LTLSFSKDCTAESCANRAVKLPFKSGAHNQIINLTQFGSLSKGVMKIARDTSIWKKNSSHLIFSFTASFYTITYRPHKTDALTHLPYRALLLPLLLLIKFLFSSLLISSFSFQELISDIHQDNNWFA